MFRPDFRYEERRPARVEGWVRRFGQPSVRNWGRPNAPAPTCSLVPGSDVSGVAFGISPERREATLQAIHRREARPVREVDASVDGDIVRVLTWVMDSAWADHSIDELVAAALLNIEHGGGPAGNAWTYVDGVKRSLDRDGLVDPLVDRYHAALASARG